MPFFIPIMIGASILSMIPTFLPHEEKRANEVINQDGNNYFRRQTMRTGLNSFNNQMRTPSQRNPYSKIQLDPADPINIQKYLLIGGVAIGVIVLLKVVLR